MRTFQFSDAKSHKFWNIDVQGKAVTVTYGKTGTAGQSKTKKLASPAAAQAEADTLIKEKLKKGYVETKSTSAAPEALAFEAALRENPDDRAGWCAYADYLVEQDDPRGAFMQTQLALEDETTPKAERTALKKKEKELLKEHEREWLGGLAPFVFDEATLLNPDDYATGTLPGWRHGVLSQLIVSCLTFALARVLATDPAVRFVDELHVHDTRRGYYGPDAPAQPARRVKTPKGLDSHSELLDLIGSPLLKNLRTFSMGDEIPEESGYCSCHVYVRGLEHVVAAMERVEVLDLYCKSYDLGALVKLGNLTHLRELRVYHLGGRARNGRRYEYPLDDLAKNPALANLTHLEFHPHLSEEGFDATAQSYLPLAQVRALVHSTHLPKLSALQLRLSDMGDDGVREFIASGILKRLTFLDLRHGCVTDAGAALLAACPDARNLTHLDLSRNAVTAKGLSALRKAGVKAVANDPLTARELNEREYLTEGDSE